MVTKVRNVDLGKRLAIEQGLFCAVSVFDGYVYVGTAKELRAIGSVEFQKLADWPDTTLTKPNP